MGVWCSIASLKRSIVVEIRAWRLLICQQMNQRYSTILDEIVQFIDDQAIMLNRPITDLEDVRQAMGALESIRQKQIEIDMIIPPIEVIWEYICFIEITFRWQTTTIDSQMSKTVEQWGYAHKNEQFILFNREVVIKIRVL